MKQEETDLRAGCCRSWRAWRARNTTSRDRRSISARGGIALCLLAAFAVLPPANAQNTRIIQGRVIGAKDQPLQDAIVYLENQKSLEVKTYITDRAGSFRFGQLSSDVDYQVWAKYQDHKSKTRSISSFDSKQQFEFELKVDAAK